MKTDLQYFADAVTAWVKTHKFDSNLPVTPAWLAAMFAAVDAAKTADRKRIDGETS